MVATDLPVSLAKSCCESWFSLRSFTMCEARMPRLMLIVSLDEARVFEGSVFEARVFEARVFKAWVFEARDLAFFACRCLRGLLTVRSPLHLPCSPMVLSRLSLRSGAVSISIPNIADKSPLSSDPVDEVSIESSAPINS